MPHKQEHRASRDRKAQKTKRQANDSSMTGEEPSSLISRRHRLRRRCGLVPVQIVISRFPVEGGFFICPESRGQAVTQGGQAA